MPKKIEIIAEVKADGAIKDLDRLEDKLEDVAKASEKAGEETKSLGDEVKESGAAISLLDQATGGLASRVRDISEVFKQFGGRIKDGIKGIRTMTAAQIKANLAFLANPVVLVATAVAGLTLAAAKLASKLTGDVVPVLTSLKNIFLSLGNQTKFARLQAEAYTKAITEERIKEVDRAMQVLQAFGEDTLQLEIENAERRLSLLKEGEEGYDEALTALLVLRARKAKADADKIEQEREAGRQEALKRIQEQEAFENEQKQIEAEQNAYDRGYLEEEAYLAGRKAVYGEQATEGVDDDAVLAGLSGYEDIDDIDIENDPELLAQIEIGKRLVAAEEEKNEKIKAARQDLFLNLASIFGAESKLGKAMLVAKQIQNAKELAMEVSKTIAFSKGALARSVAAVAEGSAQTAKIGFPQNIPMLIGYAAQAAGIIGAIKSAVSKEGIDVATPTFVPATVTNRPQIVQTLPQVSAVGASGISQLAQTISGQQQQTVRAYVVSGDVSSAQSLDRNIISNASI